MEIDLTTPALLFSTISLLLLAYTNRFLALARIIRDLYQSHQANPHQRYVDQINNLRNRVHLIRDMQSLGVGSLFLCVICMMLIFMDWKIAASIAFAISLLLMAASLALSIVEIRISVGALNVHLADMELTKFTPQKVHTPQPRWWRHLGRFSISNLIWISVLMAVLMMWYRDHKHLVDPKAKAIGAMNKQ